MAFRLMGRHLRRVLITECVLKWISVAKVEAIKHDALSVAMYNSVIPRVELPINQSMSTREGRDPCGLVLKGDQRDFSGNIENHQMTASSRLNSKTDLKSIHEIRGNITVEAGDLSVCERNFDRQNTFITPTHALERLWILSLWQAIRRRSIRSLKTSFPRMSFLII